jgi:hypothetical protein
MIKIELHFDNLADVVSQLATLSGGLNALVGGMEAPQKAVEPTVSKDAPPPVAETTAEKGKGRGRPRKAKEEAKEETVTTTEETVATAATVDDKGVEYEDVEDTKPEASSSVSPEQQLTDLRAELIKAKDRTSMEDVLKFLAEFGGPECKRADHVPVERRAEAIKLVAELGLL